VQVHDSRTGVDQLASRVLVPLYRITCGILLSHRNDRSRCLFPPIKVEDMRLFRVHESRRVAERMESISNRVR
jgi:hypothetical protein